MVVAAITVDSTGSVFPIDTSNINGLFSSRLTYHKASYLLHMIRWLIGDEHFFQAIRNYLNDEDLAFSFARTPNLISYFEQEADTSLSYFMDDWFYGEGYPIYNIEWSQDENLHFYTSISQSDAALNNHFFALDVPLRLLGQSDSLDVRFKNTTNHQMFTELVDFEVDSVIFDPEYWLISKYSSVQLSIDLKTSSSPIRIYPNPTDDLLFFDSEYNLKDLKVYNINGQECNVLRNQNMIKVSNLHAGVYYCSYSINGNLYSQKFIKQ
jgi:aminopeptidase N